MTKEIIILTISMGNDGAERVLSELSTEWVKLGNKVTVIQTHPNSYGVKYSLLESIEIININVKSQFKLLRYVREIKAVIKILNKRPNATVISFIVSSIFISAVSSYFIKNKIVVSERNNPRECPNGKIQRMLRDWSFEKADVCVFQTKEALKMFPKRVQKKGVIIPNPINNELPNLYEGERRKVIVAACRLHPQKNLQMLINAFYMLHLEHPDYKLEIYGQGDERCKLIRQIKALDLEETVLLPGFSSDIHMKMRNAAIYVSSSDYEGISNSMLEALAMGVPTVVTDCPVGGARMVIENGINGLLVPVGDKIAFYKAMKRVIEDKSFAMNLSKEAIKIREKYPMEKISVEWEKIL